MKAMLTKYNKKNTLGFSNTVCSKQKKVLQWSLLTWNSNMTTDKSCWRFFLVEYKGIPLTWKPFAMTSVVTAWWQVSRFLLRIPRMAVSPRRRRQTSIRKAAAGAIRVSALRASCVLTLFKLTLLSEVIFRSPFLQLVPREGHCSLRGGGQPLPNPLLSKIGKTLDVIRVREISRGCVQPCLQVSSATQDSWHVHFG